MKWVTGAFKLIPLVLTAVEAVERFAGKKGKEKQDAAVDLVGRLVPLIEDQIDKEVVDEAEVQDALRKVIDAVVALMNVIRDVADKRRNS